MELKSINHWLRKIGLVLVIQVDHPEKGRERNPTFLWIEKVDHYNARCRTLNEAAARYGVSGFAERDMHVG